MIYIVILVLLLLLVYIIVEYNNIVKLNTMVDEGFSTMDVYLKKRWDLIPNIVNEVKEHLEYEEEVFEKITNLRSNAYDELSNNRKINMNEQITDSLNKVMVISEGYPELKVSQSFLELTRILSEVENDIANARKYYNGVVKKYNNKIKVVPSNIVAMIFGYEEKKMFEAAKEERENVYVSL